MLSRARQLALSSHPGPTLAVTALAALLATSLGYAPARIAVLAVAILLGQLSIGFSNDWIDAPRDAASGRTDKPVAQGLIPRATVFRAAVSTAVIGMAVSIALGPGAAACHFVLVAAGWAYNAGLKRTPVSVLPFVVAFGLLPSVVTLSAQEGTPAAPWATAVGAIFGVAIHFTNVLPDLADDAATGVHGLPHRLGARTSGLVAFGALVLSSVIVVAGTRASAASLVGLVVAVGIAAWGTRLLVTRPPDRMLFRLVIAAAVVLAAELIAGGAHLAG